MEFSSCVVALSPLHNPSAGITKKISTKVDDEVVVQVLSRSICYIKEILAIYILGFAMGALDEDRVAYISQIKKIKHEILRAIPSAYSHHLSLCFIGDGYILVTFRKYLLWITRIIYGIDPHKS